jgi:mRNA-degrading endonuclease RelE of RelBE toxin-antitoxin system
MCREEAARQEEPLRPESIRALPALHQRKGTPTVEGLGKIHPSQHRLSDRVDAQRPSGHVKKLEAKGNRYRLRIGSHRVLFTLEGDQIAIYASKTERKRMSDTTTADHPEPLTLERVYRELQVLRERVEDLEDLRDLGEAVAENAGKPLIPWEEAKKDLDLD